METAVTIIKYVIAAPLFVALGACIILLICCAIAVGVLCVAMVVTVISAPFEALYDRIKYGPSGSHKGKGRSYV